VRSFRIGTRKSALAKVQSEGIRRRLEGLGLSCEIVEIMSRGDEDRTTPLYQLDPGSPGLFTKQLESKLLEGVIDLAVHSLKDLPTVQPAGLEVGGIPERADAGDCLVIAPARFDASAPLGLARGARVGTSSLRREAQLLAERSDLQIVPLRGNVPTRVAAAAGGKVDAVVLAEAGLHRLGLDLSAVRKVPLGEERFVGAPGQGALALEVRSDCPDELRRALASLHDETAARETRIERRILRALEGGCTLPLGVRCRVRSEGLSLRAFLGVTGVNGPRWNGFHHFDFSHAGEDTLVDETVRHFQTILHAKPETNR
jgi:hydroxymethylbilane synthase